MFSSNNKVSIRQFQILLMLDIFGMGITFLPKKMSEFAGQNGWICIIVGIIFACICAWISASLAERFPSDNFVTYTGKIVTKPVAILITVGFILKIIISLSMELRIFSEIVKQTILFNTPSHIISLCMIFIGAYGSLKGYDARGKIGEILIFLILVALFIILGFISTNVDYTNLLPFFDTNSKDIFTGSFFALFMFSGIEFILLAYPYLKNYKRAKKESIKAIVFIGIIMTFITIITISKFGIYDIKNQVWPVLELMNTVDLPGAFLERQDAIVMSFWIMSIFIIINSGLFFSTLLTKNIFIKGKNIFYILGISLIVFFISLIPENINEIIELTDKIYIYFGFIYILIIPLLLLIIAKIRKLGEIDAVHIKKN